MNVTYSLRPRAHFQLAFHQTDYGPIHRLCVHPDDGPLWDLSFCTSDLSKLLELRDTLTAYIEGRMNGHQISKAIQEADESDLEVVLAEGRMAQWPA